MAIKGVSDSDLFQWIVEERKVAVNIDLQDHQFHVYEVTEDNVKGVHKIYGRMSEALIAAGTILVGLGG